MKELIEKILRYLPQCFTNFGSLFAGPKRFIGQRNTAAEDTFGEALLFLGISLILVVIMTAPLLSREKTYGHMWVLQPLHTFSLFPSQQ